MMLDLTNIENGNDVKFLYNAIILFFDRHTLDNGINVDLDFNAACLQQIHSDDHPDDPTSLNWDPKYPTIWSSITLDFTYVNNGQLLDGDVFLHHIPDNDYYEVDITPFGFELSIFPLVKIDYQDLDYFKDEAVSNLIKAYMKISFRVNKKELYDMILKLKLESV